MDVELFKYQGNGNDFILIDNRTGSLNGISKKTITALCNRRFGVGADGLILLNKRTGYDFEMKYFNSDGRESTMCGNGGRCILQFSHQLNIVGNHARFMAIDGEHEGVIKAKNTLMLKMKDVAAISKMGTDYTIDTGSPHYVRFVKNIEKLNVPETGRKIRNLRRFKKNGINVNFVQMEKWGLKVRTYERGVEDETLSCGTGVVASALVASLKQSAGAGKRKTKISTPGGHLQVWFTKNDDNSFSDIWLIGGAKFVFSTIVDLRNIESTSKN